jgi:hypothetical protein
MDSEKLRISSTFANFLIYRVATTQIDKYVPSDKSELLPVAITIILLTIILLIIQINITTTNAYINEYIISLFTATQLTLSSTLAVVLGTWGEVFLFDTPLKTIFSLWILFSMLFIAQKSMRMI